MIRDTVTTPKKYVFVLMPFQGEFDEIYQKGIKAACEDAGAFCQRVDEQIFQERILDRIYSQIDKADILVADMTDRNPNVFYEVGYAHALGKNVILLTSDSADIPFDLKHHPHIIYNNDISILKEKLREKISWFVENPERIGERIVFPIELYIGKTRLLEDEQIDLKYGIGNSLNVHNPSVNLIRNEDINFKILKPKRGLLSSVFGIGKEINLPDGSTLTSIDFNRNLYPFSWESIITTNGLPQEGKYSIVVYTKIGPHYFPVNAIREN